MTLCPNLEVRNLCFSEMIITCNSSHDLFNCESQLSHSSFPQIFLTKWDHTVINSISLLTELLPLLWSKLWHCISRFNEATDGNSSQWHCLYVLSRILDYFYLFIFWASLLVITTVLKRCIALGAQASRYKSYPLNIFSSEPLRGLFWAPVRGVLYY